MRDTFEQSFDVRGFVSVKLKSFSVFEVPCERIYSSLRFKNARKAARGGIQKHGFKRSKVKNKNCRIVQRFVKVSWKVLCRKIREE